MTPVDMWKRPLSVTHAEASTCITMSSTGPLNGPATDSLVFTFNFKGVGLDVLAGRGHGDHVERKFTL